MIAERYMTAHSQSGTISSAMFTPSSLWRNGGLKLEGHNHPIATKPIPLAICSGGQHLEPAIPPRPRLPPAVMLRDPTNKAPEFIIGIKYGGARSKAAVVVGADVLFFRHQFWERYRPVA